MSNNVAEYAALMAALEWFTEQALCDAEIVAKGDSMLVINQMFGSWKIKEGLYIELAHQTHELLTRFTNIQGQWISRGLNDVADKQSKAALRRAGVKFHGAEHTKANAKAGLSGLIAAQRDNIYRDKRDSLSHKPSKFRSKKRR